MPIELGFGEPRYRLENLIFCPDGQIIERYANMSLQYGTKISVNEHGIGVVEIEK